jgi:molybdate transport system substrate-binding protein
MAHARGLWFLLFGALLISNGALAGPGAESLVIAASPSVKALVQALGREFERTHPWVRVKVYYDSGLDLRRTIAAMENSGRYFIGTGPVHIIAPGGDELITRLEQKYYVLPGTRRAYAAVPLALVVPAALVEAPASFQELGRGVPYRIAIADPALTELGRQSDQLFEALGIAGDVKGRLDVASDARGVLDHLLYGQADVGIIFRRDAVPESERVRIVATSTARQLPPTVHSMAMERYCPNRALCGEFLSFLQSVEAKAVIRSLGYQPPDEQ